MSVLAEEDKGTIRQMREEELIQLHMGLGMRIRNEFGLWRGNEALLRATKQAHPDEASAVIIQALWQRLQETQPTDSAPATGNTPPDN